MLLHGWPHTWRVWHLVIPALVAAGHFVVTPDLRGMGATDKPDGGYDLHTLADDVAGVLDALGVSRPAGVVALDAGAPVAWMAGFRHPDRVDRVVVMESLLGTLPGAEAFLAAGPPWWFGFHATPGLAETVLVGHEAEYVDFFLRSGTFEQRGVDAATRDAFVAAYTGREALRGGFEHYRAMAGNAELVAAAVAGELPAHPTLAVVGGVVGDAIARQLAPITPDLATATIDECGHLVPLEQPDRLAAVLVPFLADARGD